jgi:antitoxin VapB
LRKEGDRLTLEPVRRTGLIGLLVQWEPIDEAFPEVAHEPAPREDVFG